MAVRQGAARVAERVRALVENHQFMFEGRTFPVTISLGVAGSNGGERLDVESLVRVADAALYRAKEQGRNRVVVSTVAESTN